MKLMLFLKIGSSDARHASDADGKVPYSLVRAEARRAVAAEVHLEQIPVGEAVVEAPELADEARVCRLAHHLLERRVTLPGS